MKQYQQSSYEYNNNYGYDENNKQISYSDSYEDMKKYSTISYKRQEICLSNGTV